MYIYRKIRFILIFLAILVSLYTFSEEKKEGIIIRAKGFATAPNYLVKQIALEEAIKNGFEQYLISILPEKYFKFLRSIVSKSSRYIISLKITDEVINQDSCSIEVELELDDESINRDVSTFILPYLETLPSILILESGGLKDDQKKYVSEAIQKLVEKLEGFKFNVSSENAIPKTLDNYYKNFPIVDIEEKKQFAMATDYDIVVFISASTTLEKMHPSSDFVSCRGSVELEIFRGNDGKLLDSYASTSLVNTYILEEGIRQSIEDAVMMTLPKVIANSILGYLNRLEERYVTVKLDGFVENNSIVDIITTYFEKVTNGCKFEVLCNLPGITKIRLHYDGPIVSIVDSLDEVPELKDSVTIKKVVGRNIHIVPKRE